MNIALAETILYVTGKQGLQNSSHDELQKMVTDYPYFAPAQLVYAAKLKNDNSFKLQTQIQKTGLFFNNFRWLQHQLMEVDYNKFVSGVVDEKNATVIVVETAANNNIIENNAATKNSIETEETVIENSVDNPLFFEDVAAKNEENDFISNMSIPSVEDVKNIMSGIDDRREETVVENFEETPILQSYQEVDDVENKVEEQNIIEQKKDDVTVIESFEETILNNSYNNFEINEEPIAPSLEQYHTTETITEPENDIHAEIAALKANWHQTHPQNSSDIEESITEKEVDVASEPTFKLLPEEKEFEINTTIPNLRADWDKPIEAFSNAPLPFETEPYYTIDYFASQGIKFDYSKEPHDKLTTKMFKFTDWLRKMKTTTPENVYIEDDPELDRAIQNIAATSNQTKEIVTETMAEIFAKQGKTEKAIQLYIKLSFLIPDKTTYFASKIKELKGI